MKKPAAKVARIRERLLSNGVKNLKEFGYPDVTVDNILTDDIYKEFFRSILGDNRGLGFDSEINALIKEIK